MMIGIRAGGACLAILLCLGRGFAEDAAACYDATACYRVETLRGWTLRVSTRFDQQDPSLLKKVREELDRQFAAIQKHVPAEAVEKLKQIEIWVEVNDPQFPCMCYHANERWLRANGVNPEKTGHVELANARNFLSWTRQQPWMVLHEMAHGYHARFLPGGFENREIAAALQVATEQGRYGTVNHVGGGTRSHYAAKNPMEYFAESTEAYFGRNDFFPYERAELIEYDPEVVALLERLWGVRSDAEPVSAPRPSIE